MAASSHNFLLLPAELRLAIWEFAVVDRTIPGANFLNIQPHNTFFFRNAHLVTFAPPSCGYTCNGCSENDKMSWEHRAPRCLADSGLWDACKESRGVMKSALTNLGGRFNRYGMWGERGHYASLPMTALVPDHLGTGPQPAMRRFTFMPSKDLFVLNLAGICNGRAKDLRVDPSLSPSWLATTSSLLHVAFEMQPSWLLYPATFIDDTDEDRNERSVMLSILLVSTAMGARSTIYLIDYRLRHPDPSAAPEQRAGRLVFQATGGRFIEVEENDGWIYGAESPPASQWLLRAFCEFAHRVNGTRVKFKVLAWRPN